MALDMSMLRKKLDRMQGNSQRSAAFWKPQEGRNVIRIVPWKDRPEWPFIEMQFHYLGGRTQLSPLTNGNPDPIQEFADSLIAEGGKDGWQQAKPFRAKLRTYVPIIDRADPSAGVQFYSFGKTVYKSLLTFMDDPDIGDITDVEEGFDIVVNYTPRDKSDTNFPVTEVHIRPKACPLHDDPDTVENWLSNQPNIGDLFDEPSYEELASFLEKYLGGDEESDDEEYSSITEETTNQRDSETASVSSVQNTVDEFESLFNES